MSLNHFLSCKGTPSCPCSFVNFETGGFPEIDLVGCFLSSLYLLIFGVVSLLDLLVSDLHLSPVKLPVLRLFDKTLSLDTQAALKEDTCDL